MNKEQGSLLHELAVNMMRQNTLLGERAWQVRRLKQYPEFQDLINDTIKELDRLLEKLELKIIELKVLIDFEAMD